MSRSTSGLVPLCADALGARASSGGGVGVGRLTAASAASDAPSLLPSTSFHALCLFVPFSQLALPPTRISSSLAAKPPPSSVGCPGMEEACKAALAVGLAARGGVSAAAELCASQARAVCSMACSHHIHAAACMQLAASQSRELAPAHALQSAQRRAATKSGGGGRGQSIRTASSRPPLVPSTHPSGCSWRSQPRGQWPPPASLRPAAGLRRAVGEQGQVVQRWGWQGRLRRGPGCPRGSPPLSRPLSPTCSLAGWRAPLMVSVAPHAG